MVDFRRCTNRAKGDIVNIAQQFLKAGVASRVPPSGVRERSLTAPLSLYEGEAHE